MRAEIRTGLEKMKATELEANQQKIEAVAKHYEGVPYTEAMQLLTALQDQASIVLCIDPKGATYEETIWAMGTST
jgi:hypothetical protein